MVESSRKRGEGGGGGEARSPSKCQTTEGGRGEAKSPSKCPTTEGEGVRQELCENVKLQGWSSLTALPVVKEVK